MSNQQTFPPLGALPLAREDLDRGCLQREDPAWLPTLWSAPETKVLRLHARQVPVYRGALVFDHPQGPLPEEAVYLGRGERVVDLSPEDLDGISPNDIVLVPSGSKDTAPQLLNAHRWDGAEVNPGRVQWLSVREVAAGLSGKEAGLFVEAVAIANWHSRTRFCSHCGHRLVTEQSGWVKTCPAEGIEHFPRTDPAIIVAITDDDDRILLGNNATWAPNRYSTLAGFVEPGESLEAAVIREVYEEAGAHVADPQYLGSQPWPFPQSLMLGFRARATDVETIRADNKEMRSVTWFTKAEMWSQAERGEIYLPGSASIARMLIEHWYGGPLPDPHVLQN
ncbi:NAD(+) diphosphatase [Auritidibacter ignavus]|uniref:NAD(+) diphosphatase n=1 Tax=Auritidibacter ignavus TaxID=678932 RepID=UPI00244C771C|nr:NAD(+) diphosphatase [Auritidibacter ignavus]WGH83952.1 NAD(+) diphosphatase [Auritidibacter ignavus]